MRFNPETKTYKLFSALHKGETVTASQAEKRFGVKNISAEVSRIRQAGFAVYANQRVAGNGVKVTEYVIGKPSRNLVDRWQTPLIGLPATNSGSLVGIASR